ncbi:nose resistant to fluoxetine protein 6 isoform X2 [Megachile rotundata]|uniref:nose resistant to fluoxetine protein 6 isoform X2 n=1 Tax=Megachile rotundata TaxID=143995 RepID=UPI000258D925|nr:PREDICTED: nose resistant to fluoxetine protein 6 [Megachile rotundata]XP_012147066.1 PREDICTED: nose resistant to fluoxetine protein 6 [Megachile rotundata]
MTPIYYLLILSSIVGATISKNESNILRLGKSREKSSIIAATPNSNETDLVDEKEASKERRPLIGFSKNNPELDWKNYLQLFDEKEEEHRDLDVDFMKEKLEKTANSIQWLADLYDPLKWARLPGKLDDDCRRDMEFFLKSLQDGKLWAAKMSDASGRYSSQFYFGNGFWLGSSTLCKELNGTDGNIESNIDDRPPYPVKFHVARIALILPKEIDLSERQLFLGLCLPATCGHVSLTSMLRSNAYRVELEGNSTYRSAGPKIRVVSVKPVPSSDYTAWNDPKFYVLSGIGGTILFLMVCATIYEYRTLPNIGDVESSSVSNNNERLSNFSNKNLNPEHATGQENGEELIEKGKSLQKDLPDLSKKEDKRGFWLTCLTAFNPIANGSKILSTEPAARDSLTCLHGLRVLSLGWVVMVHTYLQVYSIAENKTLRTVTERNFMFQTISNATFSVDTFFFISGLLVTILFYRSSGSLKNDKENYTKTCFNKFVIMIVYRFIRLTPAYLFVLGINEIAIKHTISRTVFSPTIIDHLTCEKFWWRNALYVSSLYPREEMCMLWSWYMANDTQFYVLGIFLLLLSIKYTKAIAAAVLLVIVSSWFTTFSIAYANDYVARIQTPFALFDELYDKPWLRAGPYFVGVITGYILFKTNCKLKLPVIARLIGWILSTAVMFSLVYGLYPGNLTVTVSSVYVALGHTAWAMGVSFIVIQCCTGSAKMIDSLLSLRLMYPLSRLTYCAYLVHPIIMMVNATKMDGPLHLHNDIVLILYFGNLVASYLISFCVSIALEAPVVNLLKIAFTSKKRIR